jgi:hypothetical protein
MTKKESRKASAVLLLRGCAILVNYIKSKKLKDPEFLEFLQVFENYKESLKE